MGFTEINFTLAGLLYSLYFQRLFVSCFLLLCNMVKLVSQWLFILGVFFGTSFLFFYLGISTLQYCVSAIAQHESATGRRMSLPREPPAFSLPTPPIQGVARQIPTCCLVCTRQWTCFQAAVSVRPPLLPPCPQSVLGRHRCPANTFISLSRVQMHVLIYNVCLLFWHIFANNSKYSRVCPLSWDFHIFIQGF